jgi:hypothetical protein
VGATGLEQPTDCRGISQNSIEARTFSRTPPPAEHPEQPAGQPIDPDLAAVIEAWPSMPAATRMKIIALATRDAK